MQIINEKYKYDREHKHSWRYKPVDEIGIAKGMSIYLPKISVPNGVAPPMLMVNIKVA